MTDDEITVLHDLATRRSMGLSALVRKVLAEGTETTQPSTEGDVNKSERRANVRSGLFSGFFA